MGNIKNKMYNGRRYDLVFVYVIILMSIFAAIVYVEKKSLIDRIECRVDLDKAGKSKQEIDKICGVIR